MTPQERQLVAELFERLAALEKEPRDPGAEQAIREGLAKAPHAVYPLVQTVLVQDEALKTADQHIRELESALQGGPEAAGQPRGFLDNMRDALFGREERAGGEQPRGSVPPVRPGEQPMGVPPQYRSDAPWGGAAQPGGGVPPPMRPESSGGGGSFLGTAAAAAAGVIGGGLLLSGIRNMLGSHQQGGAFAGTFDEIASGGSRSPRGDVEGSNLAREAGLDDVGRGERRADLFDDGAGDPGYERTAGPVETGEAEYDDSEFGDDVGSDDSDYA